MIIKIYLNDSLKKEFDQYTRPYDGKLYIYYLSVDKSGVYECYLPNGQRDQVILTVNDPNVQPVTQKPSTPRPRDEDENVEEDYSNAPN